MEDVDARGWSERHRSAIDAAVAVLTFAVVAATTVSAGGGDVTGNSPTWSGHPVWLTLLCAGLTLPLAWRRTRPGWSAAAIHVTALVQMLNGVPTVLPADLLVPFATYNAVAYGGRTIGRVAVGSAAAGTLLLAGLLATGFSNDAAAVVVVTTVVALCFAVAIATGLLQRARLQRLDMLAERARRLEAERDEQAQIATLAERTRIAREMHDIVAHSLTVLIAQADGGRYAAASDPAAATRSLETISEVGRAALADMRQLLGVLREPEHGDGSAVAARGPQPGVEGLPDLIEQVRDTGTAVSFVAMGEPRVLPPGSGLVVHRVAQEALTNVLKHAGPSVTATVLLAWKPDRLVLEVSDDGRGASTLTDGQGQGIIGMRERAALAGGAITVGPRPGGGHRVHLEIPLPLAATSEESV